MNIYTNYQENIMADFDYNTIPLGYYDDILENGPAIRRFWHWLKFNRVLAALPKGENQSIMDVGCFAGSFLKQVPEGQFSRQLGIDILEKQIAYANEHHGTQARSFKYITDLQALTKKPVTDEKFDVITVIEVIEHLHFAEIRDLMEICRQNLKPGGELILTTPNYTSIWPALEFYLNHFADITYEEQHITKFNFFNFHRKLQAIYPPLKNDFMLQYKTTTHFITPFLAPLNFKKSQDLSKAITPKQWPFPLGPLILAKYRYHPKED